THSERLRPERYRWERLCFTMRKLSDVDSTAIFSTPIQPRMRKWWRCAKRAQPLGTIAWEIASFTRQSNHAACARERWCTREFVGWFMARLIPRLERSIP